MLTEDEWNQVNSTAEAFHLTPYPRYSGRGMYGRECFGVYGTPSGFASFMFALGCLTGEADGEFDNIEREIGSGVLRIDSLGLDTIFYWPALKYSGPELEY